MTPAASRMGALAYSWSNVIRDLLPPDDINRLGTGAAVLDAIEAIAPDIAEKLRHNDRVQGWLEDDLRPPTWPRSKS